MNERRTGLEKVNASVEPAKDGRRPQLALEVSNIRTGVRWPEKGGQSRDDLSDFN
jgi:hypothetical protein